MRVCACRNMNRALPHKQRFLCKLSSEKSSLDEAFTAASFLLPQQNQPGRRQERGVGGGIVNASGAELSRGPVRGYLRSELGLLAPRTASFVPAPSSQFLGYYRRSCVPDAR